ncbi:carboxypeptidase-like regulatory domain-containing protein [Flavobacterium hercynium]|uniref:TonB-dependent receptor n=1 Tax=Flavobacterium hercynium TaxID=387094 RepID=A0A226GPS0_9FLAO|nr:carboxypeptidase-like regulatory domain-containing protein [Flavobacterium hercynium]OXA84072.1 TonB-dependent receptor [Flavobacterium hercynium]SMP37062.1 CarboxypepD_reg-like domain-containing protein [Flavobacterium hercynium]
MKKKYLIFFILLRFTFVFAQQETIISGIVVDAKTQNPLENVVVSIQNTAITQLTSSKGNFTLHFVVAGEQLLLLHSQGYKDMLLKLNPKPGQSLDLGILQLEDRFLDEVAANLITISESDLSDDNSSSEMTSGLLQSSKDAFMQASAFNWGQAKFRIRGLDSENGTMMLNGLLMNKVYDGRPQWSNWGGLNDVLRNQEFSMGAAASNYTFGGILGTQQILTQASTYRKGSKVSFSASNTAYNWRAIATYASGMNSLGWSYVISAGKRIGNEGFFEGTNFDANSFFIAVEKKLNENHTLNFTGFYTPNSRGKNSPNTNEIKEFTNVNYNSYWGFQNGKKRNARVKNVEEPLLMLNHYYKINEIASLNSGTMYQFGKIGNSNIDYQKAESPDPVYYRKLPSYFSSLYEKDKGEFAGNFAPDFESAQKTEAFFLANSQIDWDEMYRTNQTPTTNSNGQITAYQPAQSHYVLYEDRTDDKTFAVNTNLNVVLTDNIALDSGITFRTLKSHQFQYLLDLLGGAYFEDRDVFYRGNQSQSDLQHPNRQVKTGDIYGYNFNFLSTATEAFTQFKFDYKKVQFFVAESYSRTNYQREGLYQNGIYPNSSLGKSELVKFENFGFKGGFTFKVSGQQWLFFNGMYQTRAPTLRNTFSNSRLNNTIVDGLENENCSTADVNYVFRSPKLKIRTTAYYALIKNTTRTSFFYAEGIFDRGANYASTDAFVSQTLTKLDKKNAGLELSFEYQLTSTLKATFAAAYGNYNYSSDPNVSITNDANAARGDAKSTFDFGKSYLRNYKQPGMPQQAYSSGLEYRDPKYWWLAANINYLTDNYIDVSPIARTEQFYRNPVSGLIFPEATEQRAAALLKQEKFDAVSLLNITGGKSWRTKSKYIGFFASVNNVFDVTYKTGGFEQARNANFRALNQDISSGTPAFGPKYFYGYGRTYFLNLNVSL